MDRKTNCTVSKVVRIHQMKPELAVTQKNVNRVVSFVKYKLETSSKE